MDWPRRNCAGAGAASTFWRTSAFAGPALTARRRPRRPRAQPATCARTAAAEQPGFVSGCTVKMLQSVASAAQCRSHCSADGGCLSCHHSAQKQQCGLKSVSEPGKAAALTDEAWHTDLFVHATKATCTPAPVTMAWPSRRRNLLRPTPPPPTAIDDGVQTATAPLAGPHHPFWPRNRARGGGVPAADSSCKMESRCGSLARERAMQIFFCS